uniref:Uncharacterized protein n=1 Tax=Glossina palpalis gambiensis TaxID=67801 RepID=A0A1B0BW77_9MUSC
MFGDVQDAIPAADFKTSALNFRILKGGLGPSSSAVYIVTVSVSVFSSYTEYVSVTTNSCSGVSGFKMTALSSRLPFPSGFSTLSVDNSELKETITQHIK